MITFKTCYYTKILPSRHITISTVVRMSAQGVVNWDLFLGLATKMGDL